MLRYAIYRQYIKSTPIPSARDEIFFLKKVIPKYHSSRPQVLMHQAIVSKLFSLPQEVTDHVVSFLDGMDRSHLLISSPRSASLVEDRYIGREVLRRSAHAINFLIPQHERQAQLLPHFVCDGSREVIEHLIAQRPSLELIMSSFYALLHAHIKRIIVIDSYMDVMERLLMAKRSGSLWRATLLAVEISRLIPSAPVDSLGPARIPDVRAFIVGMAGNASLIRDMANQHSEALIAGAAISGDMTAMSIVQRGAKHVETAAMDAAVIMDMPCMMQNAMGYIALDLEQIEGLMMLAIRRRSPQCMKMIAPMMVPLSSETRGHMLTLAQFYFPSMAEEVASWPYASQ